MKKIRIISIILAVLMLLSSLTIVVSAKESELESTDEFYKYYSDTYATQKARVDAMELMYSNDSFKMYFDKSTAEFAIENIKTGEYTFSNPYDVNENSTLTTNLAINALRSQVLVEYSDTTTGAGAFLSSFGSAAAENQIEFKPLTNGVRVEYAIGTVETKRLIPIRIEASRFKTMILDVLEAARSRMTEAEATIFDKMSTGVYYKYYDQTDPANEIMVDVWRESYSCLDHNHEMKIYVFQGTERSKSQVEKMIRKYCSAYTYDELEYDHEITEYEAEEKELALFRLAIEYTLDDKGFKATIPARSIRFNSTNYSLDTIVLLPYLGCASIKTVGSTSDGQYTTTGGYIFIPDGSGTLLEFFAADGSANVGTQSSGVIYGIDYAKETLQSGSTHAETAKIPVFGIVTEYTLATALARTNRPSRNQFDTYTRGLTGIITEGDTFANIVANLGQMAWSNLATTSAEYNAVYPSFSVSQGDTVSAGGTLGKGSAMSTTIDTKYTGNYSVKYVLLSDDTKAAGQEHYEPSYVGMADAYRDYLIETNTIDKLMASEIESGIPLYVESFGSIRSKTTFLTFPVEVTTPLTTFENVQDMMNALKSANITNQRWILTGFGNGTMSKTYYPTYVRWEAKLGGANGFKKLLKSAAEDGIIIFPNYDFMNVTAYKIGFSMMKYASKTMSGRYATLRIYDFVNQDFSTQGRANLVSAGSLLEIYRKFYNGYKNYNVNAIAVKTMGSQLDSDFDTEAPITREESKKYIVDLLAEMKKTNDNILVQGGNSYTLHSATDIIGLPLDNSGFAISSYSVPFIGIVLHGYVNYAGRAINMSGDTKYAVLKTLENGAGLYFVLSYQNTDLVKRSEISEYYSLMYDTWEPEVVEYYNMINGAIGDMQDAIITNHEFPLAYRVDSNIAAVLFGQSSKISSDYAIATKAYNEACAKVDDLIKSQKNADAAINEEVDATNRFNFTKALDELDDSFVQRYNTGDVVSVTYTSGSKSKTFYINYNTYPVVIESNGQVFCVDAESFVEAGQIKPIEKTVTDFTEIESYTYTTKQKKTFDAAYKLLTDAIKAGDDVTKERRIVTTYETVKAMTAADNVLVSKTNDGKTIVVNYNKSAVVVKISDTDYRNIASQSYIVID